MALKKLLKNTVTVLLLACFAGIVYLLTLHGMPGNLEGRAIKNNLDQATKPFELSPERSRYVLVESLANHKTFALSQDLAEAAYPDVGFLHGKYFIYFAPGVSLLAVPFYELGKHFALAQVFTFATVSVFAVCNVLLLYLIAKTIFRFPAWTAVIIGLVFAFASSALSYAVTLYQHHITTFLILSSFYAVWQFKKRVRFSFLWALYVWLAYGIGTFVDYPNVILMLPVLCYFAITAVSIIMTKYHIQFTIRMPFLYTFIALILLLGIHGYYNYYNYGKATMLSGSLPGYKEIKEQVVQANQGAVAVVAEKNPVSFFSEENFPRGFYTLTASMDRGLLLYSPVFLLAFLGIALTKEKSNLEHTIILSLIGVNLLLYSSWNDPWGGWAFGPRYLIPSLALLSLYIGQFLTCQKNRHIFRSIFYLLFVYSAGVALLGALTTNAVPPKVEAVYLHTKYNFLLNIGYLLSDKSSSFLYNTYFSKYVTLGQYFVFILMCLAIVVYILLFIDISRTAFKRQGNGVLDVAHDYCRFLMSFARDRKELMSKAKMLRFQLPTPPTPRAMVHAVKLRGLHI